MSSMTLKHTPVDLLQTLGTLDQSDTKKLCFYLFNFFVLQSPTVSKTAEESAVVVSL